MSLTAYERETIITLNDSDDTASVYTAQRRMLNRLKKLSGAKLIESGEHDGTPWATYQLPARLVTLRAARTLTDTQRASLATRAAHARASKRPS